MANRRFIDFPIAASVGNNDIVLIWQDGLNKQTTKATLLQGSPQSLAGLTDVDIAGLINGQILQYNSTTSKWENVDRTDINLSELGDVTIVAPSNGQVLVYNSSTGKWENSSAGYVPYTGAVTTVNLGAQSILAGSFVKAGGTSAQFLKANGSVDSTAYGTGTVTSVALSMPSAFSVGGSPITTAGTLAVTGAGTVGQYIRGDGSLADFPETTGGGSSVSYYLNGSVSQGTIGGVAYREINRTPIFGAGTDISISSDGYIANFITDAGDPNKLEIPAGNWNLETYFSASSSGGTPTFYVELYKYNGTTFTLIASSSSSPELIAFGTNINPYFSTLAVPQTTLALTDRLAVRFYVETSGRTITLHTENNHLCQVITTFTTGLTALNGLTTQVQFFAVGTSGTDFAISSVTDTHTFNLPTASASNRGALSSADWTTFNNKTSNLGTVTSVGLSSATSGVTIGSTPITTSGTITLAIATASGSQNGLLSSTDWTTFNGKQNALTNPVTGTGTTNYLPKFTGASTIGNSQIFDDGTNVGIGTGTPTSFGAGYTVTSINGSSGGGVLDLMVNNTRYLTLAVDGGLPSISGRVSGLPIVLRTNNGGTIDERFRLFSDGNVLIQSGGTFTNAGFKLDVNGTGRFTGALRSSTLLVGSSLTQNGRATIATASDEYLDIVNTSEVSTKATGIRFGNFSETDGFKKAGIFYQSVGDGASRGDLIIALNTGFNANNVTPANAVMTFKGTSGNVGIATATPASKLDINIGILSTAGAFNNAALNLYNPTNIGAYSQITFGYTIGATYASSYLGFVSTNQGSFGYGDLVFGTRSVNTDTQPTERLRIASTGAATFSGDVTISKTSPTFRLTRGTTSASSLLVYNTNGTDNWLVGTGVTGSNTDYRVYNNSLGADAIYVVNSNNNVLIGTTTDAGSKLRINQSGIAWAQIIDHSNASAQFYIDFRYNGTGTGSIIGYSTFTVYNTMSDYRLKEDLRKVNGLEKINSINVYNYKWKESETRMDGVLAHELAEVLPYAVSGQKDGEQMQGVDYSKIVPLLIQSIKELKQEIDTLKN